MQLLLVLSALLTGLTGLIAGERTVDAQQVERSALAAAAWVDAGSAATPAASEVATTAPAPAVAPAVSRSLYAVVVQAAPRSGARVDERRLE